MASFDLTNGQVGIRRPNAQDCDEFLAMVECSKGLHEPWVTPPGTRELFDAYVRSRDRAGDDGFLVCEAGSGKIAGVVNINCIVRRAFQSAFLGYYGNAAFARRGLMAQGLTLVTQYAFKEMGLHRLEANIQPENTASIALAKKCGFEKEGFSPRYLYIAGQWRDHERWALRADAVRG